MEVFRIEVSEGTWTLLKAHGYKPILVAESRAVLLEHVLALTQGKGAVVRFDSDDGVRELRIGDFADEGSSDIVLDPRRPLQE